VDNAVNQAKKEMAQRYDFRGTKSEIIWEQKGEITVIGDDDYKLNAVLEVLRQKLAKRGISLKALEYGSVEDASGGLKRQVIKIRQGIAQEIAKEIVKHIKQTKLKVQAQVQGDQLRVSGKKIDELQEVIQLLKAKDMDVALQFVNMRQ